MRMEVKIDQRQVKYMQITQGMKVHFVGIAGSGMSPLARILLDFGCLVSGSDIKISQTLDELKEKGASVYTGHNKDFVVDVDLLVVSSAVPNDDEEVSFARQNGIKIVSRAELLGALMNLQRGIAVTGTHGKTTTSSMISLILVEAGADPTAIIGSSFSNVLNGGKLGRGDFMVVEADEAYGSFLCLDPEIAVITNVDDDHRDHYGSFDGIMEGFKSFVKRVDPNGFIVYCLDDANTREVVSNYEGKLISYGLCKEKKSEAEYIASDIQVTAFGSKFWVLKDGSRLVEIELSIPGYHNVSNALGAIACVNELDVDLMAASKALKAFTGARRRCQVLTRNNGVTVIDDYAHHPKEIEETLKALRGTLKFSKESGSSSKGRLIAIFQPQRYTRTQFLMNDFAKCFSEADVIGITQIYSEGTGESPIEGVSGEKLSELVAQHEGKQVEYFNDKDKLRGFLRENVRPGDFLVMMGAGDIYKVTHEFASCVDEGKIFEKY